MSDLKLISKKSLMGFNIPIHTRFPKAFVRQHSLIALEGEIFNEVAVIRVYETKDRTTVAFYCPRLNINGLGRTSVIGADREAEAIIQAFKHAGILTSKSSDRYGEITGNVYLHALAKILNLEKYYIHKAHQ